MALRSAPFLLLVLVMVALQESCFGSSLHSLKYFFTSISEPSQGHFIAVGSLDGQVFVQYDSHSQRMKPQVSWMEKVGKEDPHLALDQQEMFRDDLETLRSRYNQSEVLHTLQWMFGCELSADGSKGGSHQYSYEGRTFDPKTLTWVAHDPQAQITQRNQIKKAYEEEKCIMWLKIYLSYRSETLQKTETPKVTVSSRLETKDGMETHVCRVDGFYPGEIDASWRRDGEVWLQGTLRGSVAPNADGTYHYWLSIRIDPKERDRYRCHVEHDGLQEPLDVPLKGERPQEPTNSNSNLGLIIVNCVVAVLVLVGVIAGILIFFKTRQDDYKAAPRSSRESSIADQGSIQTVSSLLPGDTPSIKREE